MNVGTIRTILIVEDELDYIRIVIRMLRGNFAFIVATTLADGIRQFKTGLAEAVLLDLSLPDSTREETVKAFKLACPNVPIVVVSGTTDPETVKETILDNASGYIRKSIDDKDQCRFCREIEHAIESHREIATLRRARDELAKTVKGGD